MDKRETRVDLPRDIIEDILIRLPVKTLTRFKCVCLSWFCFISDPRFIKTHLAKSSVSITMHRLLLSFFGVSEENTNLDYDYYCLKSCPLDLDNDNDAHVIDHTSTYPIPFLSILGSCNGLVCIRIRDYQILLWNPSIKKSKKLPVLDDISSFFYSDSYGFGYDQSNDDYIVIRIFSYDGCQDTSKVQVYSLKDDSWGGISDFRHKVPGGFGLYVNGALYWEIQPLGLELIIIFLSLILENMTYREVSQPFYGDSNVIYVRLGVLEGYLSTFCEKTYCLDIWVMNSYGVGDTWTKLYTIAYTPDSNVFYDPLCISMTGEILLNNYKGLRLYNPNNFQFRDPIIGKLPCARLKLMSITYVESLVSPNTGDEESSPQH